MPVELDIARRLSFSKAQRSFTRWVAVLSATGMAVGVASLIVVLSVMNGLAGELTGRLLNAVPHVSIMSTGSLVESRALSKRLQADWAGARASPFLRRQVMLRSLFVSAGAELSGYEADQSSGANVTVVDGDLAALFTERYGVALGDSLAQQLGLVLVIQLMWCFLSSR